jgi:hypothetical protein
MINLLSHLNLGGIDSSTPVKLVERIFNDLNIDWSNPEIKILDVKSNKATFSLIIIEKLLEHGHHIDHILDNMIYAIDGDKIQSMTSKKAFLNVFKRSGNIYHEDFLTYDFKMKFDLVVGNPPFKELATNGRQTNKSIWKNFLIKSVDLTKDGGQVCLITPTGWCAPSDNAKIVENIFSKYNLIYSDISDEVKNHFKGVGSTFGFTILVKEPYQKSSKIKTNDGVHIIDLTKTKLITQNGLGIIEKITNTTDNRCQFILAGKSMQYSGVGYHTDDRPESATFKNIHHVNSRKDYLKNTTIPVRWSENKSEITNRRKVVIPYNGPVNVIVDDGEYGVGWCQTLLLNDNESVVAANQLFNSKLFKFFANQKHTQYNETKNLNQFPRLDMTREWSDQEIYRYFKITDQEIKLIESTV